MHLTPQQLERFFIRVDVRGATDCWEWLGGRDKDGYGKISLNYKDLRAHRIAYALFKGQLQANYVVMHSCDNPSCVNPEHLFQGTVTDNNRDTFQKNRWKRIQHWNKYPDEFVTQLFKAYQTYKNYHAVGRMFGLDGKTVWQLLNRKQFLKVEI